MLTPLQMIVMVGTVLHKEQSHQPFGAGTAEFTHLTANLTGCGATRGCSSMVAAPLNSMQMVSRAATSCTALNQPTYICKTSTDVHHA